MVPFKYVKSLKFVNEIYFCTLENSERWLPWQQLISPWQKSLWPINRVSTLSAKPAKPGILSYTFPCLENAWNLFKKLRRKNWNFNSKPEKNFNLVNLVFQDSLFKMSFTKYFHLHLCHIYNIVIQSQIDLKFHCFYLEITWEIHGISCHQRSGNPV